MSNLSYYEDYQYPPHQSRETPPRVSSDTIVRSPIRPMSAPPSRTPEDLDRYHIPNISTNPMFRPFRIRNGWGDEFYHLQDLDRFRTEYEIEIIKDKTSVSFTNQMYRRETRTEASLFKQNNHTYYRLNHGDEYAVKMINYTNNYVNALLKIDSDAMGKWRIKPHSSIIIERPVHNARKFTFVSESSDEALEGGVRQLENELNGLVEVSFVPLIDKRPDSYLDKTTNSVPYSNSTNSTRSARSFSTDSYESGATVLGDDSEQKFKKDMSRYFVEDGDAKITKRIRIVIDKRTRFTSIREHDGMIMMI